MLLLIVINVSQKSKAMKLFSLRAEKDRHRQSSHSLELTCLRH